MGQTTDGHWTDVHKQCISGPRGWSTTTAGLVQRLTPSYSTPTQLVPVWVTVLVLVNHLVAKPRTQV